MRVLSKYCNLAARLRQLLYGQLWLWRAEMSCKREQLSLLELPSAADIMKSPVVALSPGQRPGEQCCIDYSVALCKSDHLYEGQRPVVLRVTRLWRVAFLRRWRKNSECMNRGVRFPRALPGAKRNNWAFHNVSCTRQFKQA